MHDQVEIEMQDSIKTENKKNYNNLLTGIEPLRFWYRLAREDERVRLPSPMTTQCKLVHVLFCNLWPC